MSNALLFMKSQLTNCSKFVLKYNPKVQNYQTMMDKKENIFILSSIWSFLVRLLLKVCQHRLLHLRFGYGFNFFSSWSKSLSFYSSNRLLPFFTSSSQNRYRFICSNTSSRYHQNNSKSIRCFWYIRWYCSKKAHVRFIELMFDLKPSQSFAL